MVTISRAFILFCCFLICYSNLYGQKSFGKLVYEYSYFVASNGPLHKLELSKTAVSSDKWQLSIDLGYSFSGTYPISNSTSGNADGVYSTTRLNLIKLYSLGLGINRNVTNKVSFNCGAQIGYKKFVIDSIVIIREFPKASLMLARTPDSKIVGTFPIGLTYTFRIRDRFAILVGCRYTFVSSFAGLIGLNAGIQF